ncbi:MAG: hypothetical protein DCF15_18315 [Phormidesmis priestleyi]|uniref:Trypsin-co-occurring domain-containing protein n=1 Tax=Phormidesmis priestleyi TaxID=268141 RepID=A0A2W4YNY2_9CYAN|nr:MAG: hypothetical protein DCF15_18315 [Phormidesmis priestleyi]
MAQLISITQEDGSVIYLEATEDVDVPAEADLEEEGTTRQAKGWGGSGSGGSSGSSATAAAQSFKAIEGTIRTYTNHTLSAFKDMAHANVDKVTLSFGIRVSGEAGVPYVTKGTAESNLSITVECSFDKDR